MMNHLFKFVLLVIVSFVVVPLAFAAGDYVMEAKFQKELPKAEKGDVKAQYNVGEMYEKGKGAVKDIKKAFDWYMKAADQGDKKAAYKVGLFYYRGMAVTKDYGKAHSWFSKSAEKDYVRSQYYLGEMYENGDGVAVNYDESLAWYKKALAGGYGAASDGISRVATAQKNQIAAAARNRPRKTVATTKSTLDKILEGGWKKRKTPVEYLPSSATECTVKGKNLECESKEIKRNIGMADIYYTTKAILFDISPNGNFKVSYRNNVRKINVTSEEFAQTGEKVPVKLGWQDAEHKMDCELESNEKISCTKDKIRKVQLTR